MRMQDGLLEPAQTLYFIGDSHIRPVKYAAHMGWLAPYESDFLEIGGATAVGLRHPTSTTLALVEYQKALLPYSPRLRPIFQLGEVDCGFVIWHRAQKYGESVEMQLDASITAYVTFLAEIARAGYGDLIVTSATMPTIRDGQLDGEVAHLRRSVTATQSERTELTLNYNARLAAETATLGLAFIDFSPQLINPATGLLHERFRHPDNADHHLNPETGGQMWAKSILEHIATS